MKLAEAQEQSLWRAGAPQWAPEAYQAYLRSLRKAKDDFIKEKGQFAWFVDYGPVVVQYRSLLSQGGVILGDIRGRKTGKEEEVLSQLASMKSRMELIEGLSGMMNEGRLARRNLTKAQLGMAEAESLRQKERYDEALAKLFDAGICMKSAEAALRPIVSRYADKSLLAKWRRWVRETVEESKANGTTAIVVSKAERELTVYCGGVAIKTFEVGLGRNGLTSKLYSGDHATPEGRYHITKKVPHSRYFKALLINYPNDEDRRQFALAKRKGLIPRKVGIGGLLEIHGGGDEGMTYGCIALDDRHMQEVYDLADVGTPVTIVGSTNHNNVLSNAVDEL